MAKNTQIVDIYAANLPIKESISGTEKIVVSDGGDNKGVELSKVKEYAAGGELNEDKLKEIGVYFDEPDYWSFQGWGDFDGINFKKDLYVERNVKINGGFSVGRIQGCYQIQLDDAGYLTVGEKLIVLGSPTNYSSNQVYNAIGGLTQVYSKAETDEKLSAKADTTTASTIADGLMSKEDKAKLDSLAPKEQLFIDMWNSACGTNGKYNTETGFYELNGLTDITYEQALVIYNEKFTFTKYMDSSLGNNLSRTNLSNGLSAGAQSGGLTLKHFGANSKYEVFNFGWAEVYTGSYIFRNNTRLKKIMNAWFFGGIDPQTIAFASSNLESLLIKLGGNINLSNLAKLTHETFDYIIKNSTNTTALTITVHPTTYAYLQGTTAPTEQVGGTTELWQALVTAATNKKISFATTE